MKTIKFPRVLWARLVHFSLPYPGILKKQSIQERETVTVIFPSWPGCFDLFFQEENDVFEKKSIQSHFWTFFKSQLKKS